MEGRGRGRKEKRRKEEKERKGERKEVGEQKVNKYFVRTDIYKYIIYIIFFAESGGQTYFISKKYNAHAAPVL